MSCDYYVRQIATTWRRHKGLSRDRAEWKAVETAMDDVLGDSVKMRKFYLDNFDKLSEITYKNLKLLKASAPISEAIIRYWSAVICLISLNRIP